MQFSNQFSHDKVFGLLLALAVSLTTGASTLAQGERGPRTADSKPAAKSDAETLAEAWPDRPEWLDMYTDILQGSQLGPRDGWFRRAVAQIRFTWDTTKKAYDRDANGTISRSEFPGSDADFARLDRNGDQALTAEDFNFNNPQQGPAPGSLLFQRLDGDANGKVTREEFDALFKQLDSNIVKI